MCPFCRYEPTRSPDGSAPNTARSGYPVGGARTPIPGGLGHLSDESGSEDEAEIFIQRSAANGGGPGRELAANDELEEDLHKREEELRAELNVSTIRCQVWQ